MSSNKDSVKKAAMKRNLFLITGSFFVGLGVLGMFLPVLPTTPFLLLAAFFYARSSPRLYRWLLTTPWLGEYIRHYQEGGGVSRKTRISSIFFLWLLLGVSIWMVDPLWIKVVLAGVGLAVTYHLARLKGCEQKPVISPVLQNSDTGNL